MKWDNQTFYDLGRREMEIMLYADSIHRPYLSWMRDKRKTSYRQTLVSAMRYDNVELFRWLVENYKYNKHDITCDMIDDVFQDRSLNILIELLKIFDSTILLYSAINGGHLDAVKWLVSNGHKHTVNINTNILNDIPMLLYLTKRDMISSVNSDVVYYNVKTMESLLIVLSIPVLVKGYHGHHGNMIVDNTHYNVIDWSNQLHVKYMETYIYHVFQNTGCKWGSVLQLKAFLCTEIGVNMSLTDTRYQSYMKLYRLTKRLATQ